MSSVIFKSTKKNGRRLFPISTNDAEHLVAQGRARRIKAFLYSALDSGHNANTPPDHHTMDADLEIPTEETEAPRKPGRPKKKG